MQVEQAETCEAGVQEVQERGVVERRAGDDAARGGDGGKAVVACVEEGGEGG